MKLTSGPPWVSSALSFLGGVHIGARALHVLYIWYGLAKSLAYPSGRRGVISSFKWVLPAFATCRGRGGGSAPARLHMLAWQVGTTTLCRSQLYPPFRDCESGHSSRATCEERQTLLRPGMDNFSQYVFLILAAHHLFTPQRLRHRAPNLRKGWKLCWRKCCRTFYIIVLQLSKIVLIIFYTVKKG